MLNAVNITKTYDITPLTQIVANIKDGGCLKFSSATSINPSQKPLTGSGVKIDILA